MPQRATRWYARYSGQCGAMDFVFKRPVTEQEAVEFITRTWAEPTEVWPAR